MSRSDLVLFWLSVFVVVVALLAVGLRVRKNLYTIVYEWQQGVSYIDGRFRTVLPPGRHFRFVFGRKHDVFMLPSADQFGAVPPVDVTSADRLVFRIQVNYFYRIVDPRTALEQTYQTKLAPVVGAAAQQVAAERTLETFVAERTSLDARLLELLGKEVAGCRFTGASIAAVTLPPELRRLFAEVERARIEGLAALERARGEQAALRSLANAARLLKGNPELSSLRVLQALSNTRATIVLGQNVGLMTGGTPAPDDEPA